MLSHGYYDAYYLKAQQVRRLIAEDFRRAYQECDVILGPTSPSAAFPIGAKTDDPVQMYLNDIFTVAANLTGAPALSVPCGFAEGGLPIGMQLQGNAFAEAHLLYVAHLSSSDCTGTGAYRDGRPDPSPRRDHRAWREGGIAWCARNWEVVIGSIPRSTLDALTIFSGAGRFRRPRTRSFAWTSHCRRPAVPPCGRRRAIASGFPSA